MKRLRPLSDTHPEFSILEYPTFREYRVENWHLSRDGSGRVIDNASDFTWKDAFILAIIAFLWLKVRDLRVWFGIGALSMMYIWFKCTQVLRESVIIMPPHGIQLETHRGMPSFPLFTNRRFIRLDVLRDVVINEGLRRWDVRYYLVVIKLVNPNNFAFIVAFENLLPQNIVLQQVYRGVHNTLLRPTRSLRAPTLWNTI